MTAAALRACFPRFAAAVFACRDSAVSLTEPWGSRFNAASVARERAAEVLCREFSRQFSFKVEYVCHDVPRHLNPSIALSLYRVLQEALHNVVKHSQATHVRVELTCGGNELKLCVQDNGVGFDYDQSRLGAGLGLVSMRERMQIIGGRLRVNSRQKNGTLIEASIVSRPANLESNPFLSPNLDSIAE